MGKNQKKLGIIISYINMILHSCIGMFFTPFLIHSLGAAEYGLYQIVDSFAGYLLIINFGTSLVITRYVSKYIEENNKKEQENFLAMALGLTFFLMLITLLVGLVLFFGIEGLFKNTMTAGEIFLAKELYVIMIINIAITILANAFMGIITAYEKFAVKNIFMLLKYLLRIVTLIILLKLGYKAFAIVITDLMLTILLVFADAAFCFGRLKVKIKYHYLNKAILFSAFTFSFAVFLQAIINQVNNNVDRVILGALTNTKTVALYSVGLTIYTVFCGFTGTVGTVFMPQATRMVTNGATSEQLTDLVIKPGRVQFMLAGAVVAGFGLFGRNFITVWVGKEFLGAYLVVLILITPVTITLVQNVCTSILDAMLKRMVRSVVLVAMAALNVLVSIILVKKIGYIGAAIGTGASLVIGHVIFMNYYYSKYIGLNIKRMFGEIFSKTLPCLLITSALMVPVSIFLPNTLIMFLVKVASFTLVYMVLMILYGFNNYERELFYGILRKLKLKWG